VFAWYSKAVLLMGCLLTVAGAGRAAAQVAPVKSPPTTAPAPSPASAPSTQPVTTRVARDEREGPRLRKERAEEHVRNPENELKTLHESVEHIERELRIGRILLVAIGVHFGLNLLAWLVSSGIAIAARRLHRGYATPTIKRAQTLIQFARSIAKLLLWIIVTVTVLAEFGIQPGQSAGALGVIGLVLAGMFQQLVVDFVKGIDIAIGGHYFVGDFIQAGGMSGHVLDFTVKYTVLRTPSGQVVTLPNSQCVPSRRFPSGYVDNYVDIPFSADADEESARRELEKIGHLLNARIEAIKREPELVEAFHDDGRLILRVRVRVLPTCDWVITSHYIPTVKQRFEAMEIPLAGELVCFFVNDVPTFRRLFSRQMTDRDIAETLAAESRPTIEREELRDTPDGNQPDVPRAASPGVGPESQESADSHA
jgi:small-conductance mechanosensitive channel